MPEPSTSDNSLTVLLLVGGAIEPGLGVPRPFAPLAGRPLAEYVRDALREGLAGANVARWRVAVSAGFAVDWPGWERVEAGLTLIDSLYAGVCDLPHNERVLVVMGDAPFLTGESVADFVRQADTLPSASFVYPIVPIDICESNFPTLHRTTLRLREGRYTSGNMALLRVGVVGANLPLLRAAMAGRKSVPALARLLGPLLIARFILSRWKARFLSVHHIEAAIGRLLGNEEARAVVSSYAGVGVDIDRVEDLTLAEQRLTRKREDGV